MKLKSECDQQTSRNLNHRSWVDVQSVPLKEHGKICTTVNYECTCQTHTYIILLYITIHNITDTSS